MEGLCLLSIFLNAVQSDPRIGLNHIGLYTVLLDYGYEQNKYDPVLIKAQEVMARAKISVATYHRAIHDLDDFGYLKYIPSFNHRKKSKVYLMP